MHADQARQKSREYWEANGQADLKHALKEIHMACDKGHTIVGIKYTKGNLLVTNTLKELGYNLSGYPTICARTKRVFQDITWLKPAKKDD